MDFTIRAATLADSPTIVEFNAALAWESEQLYLDRDTLGAGVRDCLADANKGLYFLAVNSTGEIVGQTMLTYEWSDWRNGWFWWIQSVYVRPDARRLGAFRALFEFIRSQAEADPTVIGLRLYHETHNVRAMDAYRQLGFEPTSYAVMEMYPLAGRVARIQS